MAATPQTKPANSSIEDFAFRLLIAIAFLCVTIYLWPLTLASLIIWCLFCLPPYQLRPPRFAALAVSLACAAGGALVFRARLAPDVPLALDAATVETLAVAYRRAQIAALDALLPIVAHALATGTVDAAPWPDAGWRIAYLQELWPYGLVGGALSGVLVGLGALPGIRSDSQEAPNETNQPLTAQSPYRPQCQRADREARRTGGGTEWLIHGLVGKACLTILSGPYKGGKSTLVCALLRGLLTGESVLGLAAVKARRVRWFTEESPGSMRQKLRQWRLDDRRLELVYRGQTGVATWDALLAWIEGDAREGDVVVVDTLAVHVSNTPGAENSTDIMTAALESARRVAQRKGIGIVFVHHDNAGGKMRGSVAIGASVDVIGHVRLPEGTPYERDETVRHWTAESRVDETPRSLYLRLVRPAEGEDGVPYYEVLPEPGAAGEGEPKANKKRLSGSMQEAPARPMPSPLPDKAPAGSLGSGDDLARDRTDSRIDSSIAQPTGRAADILSALSTHQEPQTAPQLAATLGCHRGTLHAPLKALVAEGRVTKEGVGGKADPIRYALAAEREIAA